MIVVDGSCLREHVESHKKEESEDQNCDNEQPLHPVKESITDRVTLLPRRRECEVKDEVCSMPNEIQDGGSNSETAALR